MVHSSITEKAKSIRIVLLHVLLKHFCHRRCPQSCYNIITTLATLISSHRLSLSLCVCGFGCGCGCVCECGWVYVCGCGRVDVWMWVDVGLGVSCLSHTTFHLFQPPLPEKVYVCAFWSSYISRGRKDLAITNRRIDPHPSKTICQTLQPTWH